MSHVDGNRRVAASLVTPAGSGGISVVEVRGPGAAALVAGVFRPKSGRDWLTGAPGKLHYGHICHGDSVVDEVIVRLAARGGDAELVEVNCHGGVVAAGEVMRLLVESGACELPMNRFAALAAAACGLDSVQAEAMRLLPLAETSLAVRVLCDQVNGALSRAIAAIDPGAEAADESVRRLLESMEFGCALTRPRRLALLGRPNVGKSTLFNALVGHNRTIVSPVPGTTRDFVNEFIALGGFPVELVDTAGLRRRGGVVEMKGVEAAWRVASDADLILVVIDGSVAVTPEELAVVRTLLPKAPMLVINKSDLSEEVEVSSFPDGMDWCRVSAVTGAGLGQLERTVLQRFPDKAAYPPGSAVVFTERQADILSDVMALCASGAVAEARAKLGGLIRCPL